MIVFDLSCAAQSVRAPNYPAESLPRYLLFPLPAAQPLPLQTATRKLGGLETSTLCDLSTRPRFYT